MDYVLRDNGIEEFEERLFWRSVWIECAGRMSELVKPHKVPGTPPTPPPRPRPPR